MDKVLTFAAQYNRLYDLEKPYGCEEKQFGLVTETLELPLAETALVLIDCWNMMYMPKWVERAARIMDTQIVPVLKAARRLGMAVIHLPSPRTAVKYEDLNPYAHPDDATFLPVLGERDLEWPPEEFINRTGKYAEFAREYAIPVKYYEKEYEKMDIYNPLKPIAGEFVLSTQGQLQRLLKDKRILHLVIAGFATNMCVRMRDYGIQAMATLGYNPIILRDCTTGVETADTLDGLWSTHVALREIEHRWGYSAIGEDFVKSCAMVAG